MQQLLLIFVLIVLCAAPLAADDAVQLVNALRSAAGLPVLQHNAALGEAAARHAAYLDRHRAPGQQVSGLSAHEQRADLPGFSGQTPAERALRAGYPHRGVLENVSMGYDDAASAIEGLMSAIYHRLTFLDFLSDELGAASGERSRVFVQGRQDLAGLCASPPADAVHRAPIDCLGTTITRAYFDRLCEELPASALFRAPHPVLCPNGTRLDADYMAGVCASPPRAARFAGHGRYFAPCENGTRLDADWFHALCKDPPAAAAYQASGAYYEICDTPVRVYAEWLEQQCADLPATARYTDSGRYRRPCATDSDLRVEYLDASDRERLRRLPELVVWPLPHATDVPPAFFIEEPDPLPDLEVSGYPVTLQFNPAFANEVVLQRFELARVNGDVEQAVTQVRLLDAASDPNQLLTAHEFALFPLQRLAWGAQYRVTVQALVDGQPIEREWTFITRGAGENLLTAAAQWQRFAIRPDADYLLYLPPAQAMPFTVNAIQIAYRRGNSIDVHLVDRNTVRVRLHAGNCTPVKLDFERGRAVEFFAAGCPDPVQ